MFPEKSAPAGETAEDAFRKHDMNCSKAAEEDPLNRKKSLSTCMAANCHMTSPSFLKHTFCRPAGQDPRHGVTMTSYLAAAQMLAAYQEMPALERGKVISVSLPVNLRSDHGTDTARNFFNSIRISWVFRGDETLETLAKGFDAKLREAAPQGRAGQGPHGRL